MISLINKVFSHSHLQKKSNYCAYADHGPPGKLEQTRCTGDIDFSHPTTTADTG